MKQDFKNIGILDCLKRFITEKYYYLSMYKNSKLDPNYQHENSEYDDLIYFELYKHYGILGEQVLDKQLLGFVSKDKHVYAVYEQPTILINIL